MKRVVLNAIIAVLLMAVQANVDSAFGLDFVCHFGVIAAIISGAFALPIISSTISMLILALICDCFMSGPIGLAAFAFMLVFALARAMLFRFGTKRIIFVMIWALLLSILFDTLMSVIYCCLYRTDVYLSIFAHIFWKNALATFLMPPLVIWFFQLGEKLLTPRRRNGLL